jgi:putative membrane-bound dehydrogenase-like protein
VVLPHALRPGHGGRHADPHRSPRARTLKRKDGAHEGNPDVRKAVLERKEPQHVMWVFERPGGGRSFGFTGGHVHWNWANDQFRKIVLNAIAWSAGVEVPAEGVASRTPTAVDLEANQDEPKPSNHDAQKIQEMINAWNGTNVKLSGSSSSATAIAPLFASPLITRSTPNHSVAINVDITGLKQLYLVVGDGGNGYSCDWADWVAPRLEGSAGVKKLTDLKWRDASAGHGKVRVNANCEGKAMKVIGQPVEGIGTHANSVIVYDIPEGYNRFVATGALDDGGVNQAGGSATSVRFMLFAAAPTSEAIAKANGGAPANAPANDDPSHDLKNALGGLDVGEGLTAQLFAGEPMMLNPTAIDVDDRGRVWVAEVVNYRKHNGERPEGDRILIMEDTDGDGKADKVTVFYQGTDINSAHGVTVVGDKVYVPTAVNKLFVFTKDANDKVVDKQLLFQGHETQQHDHGYHQVNFGPDGKLYWNFGNNGMEVRDAAGNFVYDAAGNRVTDKDKPYRQGMVFRLNPDGTGLQTLGWNFRNNWEVNVDSFGTIWQSDNDDDGNRGVRINYVMPYGNYGYTDEMTGAGWRTPRTNMEAEIPLRHWHLNDPGVVPNLLQTGGGSPTGICVYEGDLLPPVFRGQIIHCDAGPNVVRSYPVKKSGAGYTAEIVPILTGARDKWFRPSDVCVAPDGSLIVADWYDPGVGGHAQGDTNRGRLFRVTVPSATNYKFPKADYSTAESAVEAIKSPNQSTRAKAWLALHAMGDKAEPALTKLWSDANPRFRARALHLLARIPGQSSKWVDAALKDGDADIRITALRIALDTEKDVTPIVAKLVGDGDAQVRREASIALRFVKTPAAAELWAKLAAQHDGKDRWYLEALGIGAALDEDGRFDAWLRLVGDKWNTPAGRDIIWRSRSDKALPLMAKIITDSATSDTERLRYFRAFDFHTGPAREATLTQLLTTSGASPQVAALSLKHLEKVDESSPQIKAALEQALKGVAGTQEFVDLIAKFNLEGYNDQLMHMALTSRDSSAAVAALQHVMKNKGKPLLMAALKDEKTAVAAVNVVGLAGGNKNYDAILVDVLSDADRPLPVRIAAVRGLGRSNGGVKTLLELAKTGKLDPALHPAAADALFASAKSDWREEASRYLKMPGAGNGKPLPPIKELITRKGDPRNGQAVFQRTCTACHKVNGVGIDFGPDLSEIGTKLPKEDIYVAILNPSARIVFGYEGWVLKKRDGTELIGYMASETQDTYVLRVMGGVNMKVGKGDVASRTKMDVSLMTPGLQQTMTEQEFVDLVEFLSSLKKAVK